MKSFMNCLQPHVEKAKIIVHSLPLHADKIQRAMSLLVLVAAMATIFSPDALAAGAMPWESPIKAIAQSLCGPLARAIAVMAIVSSGIMIAFGETKGWIHNMMIVLIGVSIAVLAPSFLSMLPNVQSDIACN